MSWPTVIWSMVAAACLTMALPHLIIGIRRREARVHLFFALAGFAVAWMAAAELWVMRAVTTQESGRAIQVAQVPTFIVVVAIVGFVQFYFGTGRLWLGVLACGLRAVCLVANFADPPNMNFRDITALRTYQFLGETVTMPLGPRNPWLLLAYTSSLLVLTFVIDASRKLWRQGAPEDRRRAVVVGGGIVVFVFVAQGMAVLINAGVINFPYSISIPFMLIVGAMGFELSYDVLRAAELSEKLHESAQRMSLAVDAANFGIWIRDLTRNEIWASDKWRELFDFAPAERLELAHVLDRVHSDDRDAVRHVLEQAVATDGHYETEFRVVLQGGKLRWIASRGRVEFDAQGRPLRVRGASLDFTARKLAEESAHDLSGRLIQAQEDAQRQLARELHDDLSQSLALLSVELEMFGQNPPAESQKISARMNDFSTEVKGLSSEVHRLSHDLHPAKLDQLGLVAAVRGFCKEFALAHQMAIEFTERDVPRTVPADAALCLYRIAQEALHNVVKHSGGTAAKVELTRDDGHLRLVVADDGAGFDPQATRTNGSLGVVSMSERARFVGGRLSIESRPGAGTRVEVRVPIAVEETAR